ncbi:MAG: ATP-binding cassette domain-containing protein [Pirellulales bacterium]|nr:ATP-binding cassette domain-containing protein [Pirellulales bacterium]
MHSDEFVADSPGEPLGVLEVEAVPAARVAALAGMVDQAAQRLGLLLDSVMNHRSSRAALEQAAGDWPQAWSAAFATAASARGMRAVELSLTPAEFDRCLAGRELLVTWRPVPGEPGPHADGEWLLVVGRKRNELLAVDSQGRELTVRISDLYPQSGRLEPRTVWCIVAPEYAVGEAPESGWPAQAAVQSLDPHGPGSIGPLRRLIQLLRRDRADLWTVVIFAVAVGLLSLAVPIAAELLFSSVIFGNLLQPVLYLTLLLGGALVFSSTLQALQIYVVELMQRRLFVRVAADLTVRLRRVDPAVWDEHHGPELVNRFFDILTVQKVGASLLLDALSLVIVALVSMVVLAFYHPFLLGFDLLLMAAIAAALFVLGRGAVDSAIAESRSKYAVVGWLEDLTRHLLLFKLAGGGEFAWRRSESLIKEYLANRQSHFRILFRQIGFSLGLQAVATTALLGIGAWLVIERTLTLGQLVAAQLLLSNIVAAFAKLGKHIEGYYDLMAATVKVGHLLDLPLEPSGGSQTLMVPAPARLELRRLSFSFAPRSRLLDRINLVLEPGQSVALIGREGSGKSALVDLIHSLRRPSSGVILLDGEDVREYSLEALRRQIVTVRQAELFDGTIAENVTLDRPEVSRRDLHEAIQAAGLLEDIGKLPDGLRTRITAGGTPLSDSQALRLTLARALAGRPRLLILDETLDRLSRPARQRLLDYLLRPQRPWTLLIVTNLEDVADRCDRIEQLDALGGHDDA